MRASRAKLPGWQDTATTVGTAEAASAAAWVGAPARGGIEHHDGQIVELVPGKRLAVEIAADPGDRQPRVARRRNQRGQRGVSRSTARTAWPARRQRQADRAATREQIGDLAIGRDRRQHRLQDRALAVGGRLQERAGRQSTAMPPKSARIGRRNAIGSRVAPGATRQTSRARSRSAANAASASRAARSSDTALSITTSRSRPSKVTDTSARPAIGRQCSRQVAIAGSRSTISGSATGHSTSGTMRALAVS